MLQWLTQHAWWIVGFSVALGALSTLAGFAILMQLPEDYFVRTENDAPVISSQSPFRLVLIIFKNLLGIAIVIVGGILALPLVPGPGLILIILGLSLTNFPGKRKLERKLIRLPLALEAVNWLRAKAGRRPLRLPSATDQIA